jgi:hypothetical protein
MGRVPLTALLLTLAACSGDGEPAADTAAVCDRAAAVIDALPFDTLEALASSNDDYVEALDDARREVDVEPIAELLGELEPLAVELGRAAAAADIARLVELDRQAAAVFDRLDVASTTELRDASCTSESFGRARFIAAVEIAGP